MAKWMNGVLEGRESAPMLIHQSANSSIHHPTAPSLSFPEAACLEEFAKLLALVHHVVMRQVGVEED